MSLTTNKRHSIFLLLGDIFLILAATRLASLIRFDTSFDIFDIHTGASVVTTCAYIISLYIFDMYRYDRIAVYRDMLTRGTAAAGAVWIFSAIIFYVLPHWKYGRGVFLLQTVLAWIFIFVWRWVFSKIFPNVLEKEKVLIIGTGQSASELRNLLDSPVSPYKVTGFLIEPLMKQNVSEVGPVLGSTSRLLEVCRNHDIKTIILAITHGHTPELVHDLLEARFSGLNIIEMPTVYEKFTGRVPVEHLPQDWLIFAEGFYLVSKPFTQKLNRIIDSILSVFLLLLTAPVILITSVAVKLESPRDPVIFKQTRVGKAGKIFLLYKFRSMKTDAETGKAEWAKENDPRITRVGRVIRMLRIDELPQIYNIFRGEMSLIGPRPERPEFVKALEAKIPYYNIRHSVPPGISGWAQINFPYGASVEDALKKLEYDIFYIKNMSIFLYAKILLKTIGVVLFGQGAR